MSKSKFQMTNPANEIKQFLEKELDIQKGTLMHPKEIAHGDFSFFTKGKQIEREIVHPYIKSIESVGGFTNITLSKKFFADSLEEILSLKDVVGKNDSHAGEKVIIEYTQPNPFKQFHIGHLMSNALGESLSRIIEWNGATIKRANYQGDVGPHVAKAIWVIQKEKINVKNLTAEVLGKMYVAGSNAYEEDEQAKKEIDVLNKIIYEKSDPKINEIYEAGRKISLDHFEEIYAKLGTAFDYYFFESEVAPIGLFLVEEFLKKGIFEKSEKAIVFKGEKYGLHTRVFITSQGLPTYETKELGVNKMKFDREDFDSSIIITANEQNDYFSVVLKAMEFVNPSVANKTRHVSHGMLRFASGKMSSRKGNIITGESLLEDVAAIVKEKIKDRDFDSKTAEEVTNAVSVGAIKYSVLKQSPGKDIIFDFEKSLSFEGDSGPYLQYTYARSRSILRKAAEEGIQASLDKVPEQIFNIERLLYRFPEVVTRAYADQAPNHIASYLIELSASFNSWYANEVIVDKKDEFSPYKIALTEGLGLVLKNGLMLLGISAPERM